MPERPEFTIAVHSEDPKKPKKDGQEEDKEDKEDDVKDKQEGSSKQLKKGEEEGEELVRTTCFAFEGNLIHLAVGRGSTAQK